MSHTDLMMRYPAFLLVDRDADELRRAIKDYFLQTFALYERLFEVIKEDASYYERPCSLRHPLIFYFGHTATFFINKLVLAKLVQRIDPELESMFAIGVDEMSWDDLNEANYQFPSVDRVRAYRQQVKSSIVDLIDRIDISFPIGWHSPVWAVLMGIEHERIHLETSSVLIRQLPIDRVRAHSDFPICPDQQRPAPDNAWVLVEAGRVTIDHTDPARLYGWDNEYGRHQADVASFEVAQYLVSNGEFLAFVQAGGYQQSDYWTEEGQGWLGYTKAQYPSFWVQRDGIFYLRTMTNEIEMPWSWPVEVNYLEAKAFCNWKSAQTGLPIRLPSEDEYLHLRNQCNLPNADSAIGIGANINLEQYASSTPVDANRFGQIYDMVGNVWQWTETPIYPFDGFKVHPLYDDFTTPTYDNKHNIFKGGSWISTGNEANLHSRYAFRRHFFQHAGFRYVSSPHPVITQYNPYETDADVVQACDAHYGQSVLGLPHYEQTLARHIGDWVVGKRVLMLGCSVGRSCFELSSVAESVVGLDRSARFIRVANLLQTEGRIRYRLSVEGEIPDFVEFDRAQLPSVSVERVQFLQQDMNNMKPIFSGYDVLIVNQVLETLSHPIAWLQQIHERLISGGLLVIASSYAWDPRLTAEQDRLGGFKRDGENVSSIDTLSELLNVHFDPLPEIIEIPHAVRHDARHLTVSLVQVRAWKKR